MQVGSFEGWPNLLNDVVRGKVLTTPRASAVMEEILEGRATSAQLAALIAVLRSRGETTAEITGFANALRAAAVEVPLPNEVRDRAVDTCGTGGDRSNTINISTTAAFVVAAGGVPVCKHGNRAASSKSGTADVLERLGVNIDPGPEIVAQCVTEVGVGFCFAPAYHPAMRFATPTRRELGIPTVFNFLGTLVNPGRIKRQVVGVSDPALAEPMLSVLEASGAVHAMVVYGDDGLDEITVTTTSTVHELRNAKRTVYQIDAADYGFSRASPGDLVGGDAEVNAERTKRILEGDKHPQSDLVAINTAAALMVGGAANTFDEAVESARSILASGQGLEVLENLVKVSNQRN